MVETRSRHENRPRRIRRPWMTRMSTLCAVGPICVDNMHRAYGWIEALAVEVAVSGASLR